MTAALLTRPPVSSRRVSAGIRPAPGATAGLHPWWGAEDWTEHEVPAALDESPEVLRDHHVSREAVLAVARGMAAYADHRTGRECRPTNERLVELLRCSLSTVQRARRALKSLGLVAELVGGRSIMTRAERLQAWRRGSSHRQVAAEFALLSRPRRAPKKATTGLEGGAHFGGADPESVDGDTPPGASKVSTSLQSRSGFLRRQTEKNDEDDAPRRAPTKEGRRAAGGGAASRRLAEDVRGRVGWLAGVSPRRMTPTLARFARAGWTVRDVELAVRDALAARGWRVPRALEHPAAYLAGLLRELDPENRPSVEADAHEAWLREQAAAQRAARRAWVVAMRTSCAHGVPAGDVAHPETGARPCRECRP